MRNESFNLRLLLAAAALAAGLAAVMAMLPHASVLIHHGAATRVVPLSLLAVFLTVATTRWGGHVGSAACGVMLGGAAANLSQLALRGGVVDYLHASYGHTQVAFNMADVMIVCSLPVAAAALLVGIWETPNTPDETPAAS